MAKKQKVKRFKESVGLDIGSYSIKLVHLKRLHEGSSS
jgi:Tfp pilus assembly PilM family ATPase